VRVHIHVYENGKESRHYGIEQNLSRALMCVCMNIHTSEEGVNSTTETNDVTGLCVHVCVCMYMYMRMEKKVDLMA